MAKELVKVPEATSIVMGDVIVAPETSDDAVRQIVEGTLAAETLGGIFNESTTIGTKDLVDVPLEILDCTFMASELADNPGNYMLIRAIDLRDGTNIVVNTGSKSIMAKLFTAKERGFLPVQVMVVTVGEARKGESAPLGLKAIGKTADAITQA